MDIKKSPAINDKCLIRTKRILSLLILDLTCNINLNILLIYN